MRLFPSQAWHSVGKLILLLSWSFVIFLLDLEGVGGSSIGCIACSYDGAVCPQLVVHSHDSQLAQA